MKWTWRDVDEIALDLYDKFPNVDPLTVKFPELKNMVLELPTFSDDPGAVTDRVLESIQMAWYDEFED
ncbi:MAG: Fe-S cluster assembly protein IscX [Bacteroidota bacterium]